MTPVFGILGIGLDGIGRAVVAAFGTAILDGIESGYNWVFAEMLQAFDGATDPAFTTTAYTRAHGISPETWFAGPWGAMVVIGMAAGVLILGIGAIGNVLQGRSGELGRQVLLSVVALVVMVSKLPLFAAQTLFDIVDAVSAALPAVVFHNASGLKGIFIPPGTTPGTPAYADAFSNAIHNGFALPLVLLVGLFASFCIWVELAAREAFAYLVVAMIPLAMAGVFWRATERWVRHLLNILVAIAMSQIIISLLMVMAGACYESINSPGQSAGQSITQLVMFIAFLCLATFSLPMALRMAPQTIEGAFTAGHAMKVRAAAGRTLRGAHAGMQSVAQQQQVSARVTQPAAGGGAEGAVFGTGSAAGTGAGSAASTGFAAGGLPGTLAGAGLIAVQRSSRLARNAARSSATAGAGGSTSGAGEAGVGSAGRGGGAGGDSRPSGTAAAGRGSGVARHPGPRGSRAAAGTTSAEDRS